MLYSTFLVLLIHLGSWSLNEDWHIYKIVEPIILTGVVLLVLASSDLAIRNFSDNWYHYIEWYAVNIFKTCGELYKTNKLVNWGSINGLQHPFTLWQVPVIYTGIGINSLGRKLFSVWIYKKHNKTHYIILLIIVAKVITSLEKNI